jgi:hypothetical protein
LIEKRKGKKMKVSDCLRIFLTSVFVLGVLTSSYAGQKGIMVSPGAGRSPVKTGGSAVAPKKVVPKEEEKKVVPAPIKKNDQSKSSTTPQINRAKPKATMPAPKRIPVKPNIIVQSFSYTGPPAGGPFKEGEGTTLFIRFQNKGNAKSSKDHQYTISCSVKRGGPGCPVQSKTKSFGKEIKPNDTYDVLLSVALKKAGVYHVTARVGGKHGLSEKGVMPSQKTVKLKVVPAPRKKDDQSKPSAAQQITRDKPKVTTGQTPKPKKVVPAPKKKLDLGKQSQKPTFPVTNPVYRAGLVTEKGKGDLKAQKKATAPQLDTTEQGSGNTSPLQIKPKTKLSDTMKFKTHLSVKLQGKDFTQWGDNWAGISPEVLKFRWKTIMGTNTFSAKWQVSTRATFNPILKEGDAGMVPGPGQYRWFYIDFKNIASLAQGYTQFLVRVVPNTESALYAPSPPVLVKIDAPESDTVFNFPPKINQTMGEPGGAYYFSPDGKLYIYGIDFGTKKGRIIIYGMGFPDGKLELNQVVWESNSRVNGRVPIVTGVKDQKVKIEVVTHDGLVSNRVEHWFRGTRERRKLKCGDPAVTVDRCSMQANSNHCECQGKGSGPVIYGSHRNNAATTSNDVCKDTFKIELKNGWKIFHGAFAEKNLSSSDEIIYDPTPQWTPSMTTWRPMFECVVSPGDRVRYYYNVTIEGPIGVPHY